MDLRALLPQLLPDAIAWAEMQAREAEIVGRPLDSAGLAVARAVGVRYPEKIRLAAVSALPLPEEPMLRAAALQTGLLGPGMAGLTLGYSILICEGHFSIRMLSHECRHVHQYEEQGSIAKFLPIYLQQIVDFGYASAPFEIDARNSELTDVPF